MIGNSELYLILLNVVLGAFPILACSFTSYLKVSLVFGLMRQALGGIGIPSNLLVFVLSSLVSMQIMSPILTKVQAELKQVELNTPKNNSIEQILSVISDLEPALDPLKQFLLSNSKLDLAEVVNSAELQSFKAERHLGWRELVLQFAIVEFQEGLILGLMLITPFILIDFVVSNILLALGLNMLSPTVISLPIKIILIITGGFFETIQKIIIGSYAT